MSEKDAEVPAGWKWTALEPLGDSLFRRIWSASLLSNFGQLVLGVGAAWEMTQMGQSAAMIALVQTALMLPLMLVAVPAGAIADMFDRRKIAITGLSFSTLSAVALTVLSAAGLAGPWILLTFCFLIGAGVALYSPAWQVSIAEQVPPRLLPAAVSLGAVSYNIARSFGPAVGGLIVLTIGAKGAFATNAVLYLPLLAAFFFWRRRHSPPRLPPERLHRAIVSGLRYALLSPAVRIVMVRSFAFGTMAAASAALTPLVARNVFKGDASTYGLLLCATGVGALVGALIVNDMRERFSPERAVRMASAVVGASIAVVGWSQNIWLTVFALILGGAANMLTISMLNVGVQLAVPRWVAARSLAWFQSSLMAGFSLGSWIWGQVAADHGVGASLIIAGLLMVLILPFLGLILPMPDVRGEGTKVLPITQDPEVALAITHRSGPIVVEVGYRVDPAEARTFYDAMLQLQNARLRNGGFDWSVSRDLADDSMWTERFRFPTWQDYLRQRTRFTQADNDLRAAADAFNTLPPEMRIRRLLERPIGSVRYRADTPDPGSEAFGVYTP